MTTSRSNKRQSRGRRRLVSAAAVLVLAVAAAAPASPAFAAEEQPPIFVNRGAWVLTPYPTRAVIEVDYLSAGLRSTWGAKYAIAEANCEPPAKEAGCVWEVANANEESPGANEPPAGGKVVVGQEPLRGEQRGATGREYLRHLEPGTHYYVRIAAKNSLGEADETLSFQTLPASKPEVSQIHPGGLVPGDAKPLFVGAAISDTAAEFNTGVESNGLETVYQLEYSLPEGGHAPAVHSASWKAFSSGGGGTITPAEEHAAVKAETTGLTPETTYYVRLKMSNGVGETIQNTYTTELGEVSTFTTLTARPLASIEPPRNVTASSAYVTAQFEPRGERTVWRFESAPAASGPWTVIPGGSGTITQAQAEAFPYGQNGSRFGARIAGLQPSTVYYVRATAENECAVGCGKTTGEAESFETAGGPSVSAFAVHALHGEALRLLGSVNPNSLPTSAEQTITIEGAPAGGTFTLGFEGQSTAPLPYNASSEAVGQALGALSSVEKTGGRLNLSGPPGGPYVVYFAGGAGGRPQPLIEADGLGLLPSGSVSVVSSQAGGEAYDTHYRFQYVSEQGFSEHGWAGAAESPEVDIGSGDGQEGVGYDLPGFTAGEAYRYRLVARSNAPGISLAESGEQSLTAPVAPASTGSAPCPNEAVRTGPSARLPDCRGFELLTPPRKEGAQEPFHYGNSAAGAALGVAEDGQHALLESEGVSYETGGQGPYLFSRGADGWSMTIGSPQPETGPFEYIPQLYNANLTEVAFTSSYDTSFTKPSADIEYRLGPVGGPYKTVAVAPRADETGVDWVAGDGDFSKLVLASEDRTLLGEEATGTASGEDLYEYTAEGGLRQLNVAGEPAATIGRCGAKMVRGSSEYHGADSNSSRYSISADGSRVFFEAVPGSNCREASHLYMRVDGERTVDLGAYTFAAANAQGTTLLLRNGAGGLVSYDTETGASEAQSGSELETAHELAEMGIPFETRIGGGTEAFAHPRYTYFRGYVAGLPGGVGKRQVYRYDSAEHVVECISCASPFDPEPKQSAFLSSGNSDGGGLSLAGSFPENTTVSANGEFAFFTTPAALVPQDVNGEIAIERTPEQGESGAEEYVPVQAPFYDLAGTTSRSSDVYEWRGDGVDGCGALQGCVALITDGRAGFRNLLLGSADEGRDVFIYTLSRLAAQDLDGAGDVYDARVDGGFAPPPAPPVECEGSACSSPPSPPNDATPSSQSFQGSGNIAAAPVQSGVSGSKPAKHRSRHRGRTGKRRRKGTHASHKKAAARRAHRATRGARRGK